MNKKWLKDRNKVQFKRMRMQQKKTFKVMTKETKEKGFKYRINEKRRI